MRYLALVMTGTRISTARKVGIISLTFTA